MNTKITLQVLVVVAERMTSRRAHVHNHLKFFNLPMEALYSAAPSRQAEMAAEEVALTILIKSLSCRAHPTKQVLGASKPI
jgi:hypothetical protein